MMHVETAPAHDRYHRRPPPVPAKRSGRKGKAKAVTLAAVPVGRVEAGTRMVDNPYAVEPGERITVVVNLAEHPLEMMLARGRLSQAHYEAGSRFRALYERAQIGGARGIDPAKVKVDGGGVADPLSVAVAEAHRQLAVIEHKLGKIGGRIVAEVCGCGVPVAELSTRWPGGENERAVRDYLSMRLKEALEVLAVEVWGATGPQRGRIVGGPMPEDLTGWI